MRLGIYGLWLLCREAAERPDIRNGVVRAIVYDAGYAQIVAFPGTGEGSRRLGAVAAWLINAVHVSVGGRHAGWLAQLASVYLPIRRKLDRKRRVIVTGYSQGAALALLLADALTRHGFDVEAEVFAPPRPFRLWYPARIRGTGYRNGGDIVTRLPTLTMLFKHGCEIVNIGRRWSMPSFRDHYPQEYDKRIKEWTK